MVHNNLVGFTPQPFRLEFMMQSSEDQKIVHSRNSGQTPSGYGSLNSETIVNGSCAMADNLFVIDSCAAQ